MPVIYQIDGDERLIRTRCIGDVTFAEVVDHFHALQGDPDCAGAIDVLLDLSEASSIPTPNQLRSIDVEIQGMSKIQFGACAVVATREVLYGMSRMFETVAAERFRSMHVFRGVVEAEDWLRSGPASGSSSGV